MLTKLRGPALENTKGGHCEFMSICLRRVVLSPVKQVARIRLSLFSNMSMKAVKILDYGDSSNLSYEDAPIPEPGKGEVMILAIINLSDITDFGKSLCHSLHRHAVILAE